MEITARRFTSINLPADLEGTPDTRPGCWGKAGVRQVPYKFLNVPDGYRVRILEIDGDLISYPRTTGDKSKFAGILWGLCRTSVTEQGKSTLLEYASDGCFVYVQDSIRGDQKTRAPFSRKIPEDSPDGLLDADHTMLNKIAIWLSEIGQSIHAEATANVIFKYELAPEA